MPVTPAVPIPFFEAWKGLRDALSGTMSDFNYYDVPPVRKYELPYGTLRNMDVERMEQTSAEMYEFDLVAEIDVITVPTDRAAEAAVSVAKRVIDRLNGHAWSFEGFGLSLVWGSAVRFEAFEDTEGATLHSVVVAYHWLVDYML